MALILVVEPEDRYVQRIRDALSSEGWQVQWVDSADKALSAAESEPPQLVLINRQTQGAERLFSAFSRRTGGPGVVAMLPESAIQLSDPLADEALAKPFTDQELRLAVRRGLHSESPAESGAGGGPSPAPTPKAERQLTTQDIFGDLVAEVESEIQGEEPEAPAPQAFVPQSPTPPPAQPAAQQPAAQQPAAQQPAASARPSFDNDLDLEKTLSGLRRDLQIDSRPTKPRESPKPAESPPISATPEHTVRPGPPEQPPKEAPRRSRISDDLDVDALLTETLSGLDLSSTKRKKRPAESPPLQEPEEAKPLEPREPDPQEISFADLSAPSEAEFPPPSGSPDAAPPSEPVQEAGPGAFEIGMDDGMGEDGMDEEVEVDLEMELEVEDDDFPSIDLESEDEPEPEDDRFEIRVEDEDADAGEDEREASSGLPLGDWLEADGDSMVEVEEPMADLTGQEEPPAVAAQDDGQRFGQYTLLDRIAVGGMAEVWKARMSGVEGFQKTVAIKKILPHLTDNDDFVDMFIDEAKLAAQLNHPNIIHIYDLGKIGDHFYIAMEYVEGKNLRALLNESRKKALPLPRGLAVLIAARLASALDHAHRKKDFEDRELGLVHRDVSPQNVLISEEGDIKLCDFGIVKAVSKASQTQMGALKGKLQYMSPEQAWGKDVDARSDIFSLGAILFEMLTGRRLFAGDNEISVLEAVRQCQVIAPRDLVPQIPEEVERITLKALEMDPERRYQTAGKLQQELESIIYSVKPALGPADLADYLKRLSTTPEVDGAAAAAATGPAAAPEAPRTETPRARAPQPEAVSSTASNTASSPSPTETQTGTGQTGTGQTGTGTLTGTGTPTGTRPEIMEPPDPGAAKRAAEVVQAGSDTTYEDFEEGGGRGRIWLWILIALLLLGGAAVTYYMVYVRPAASGPADETPAVDENGEPLPASPLDDIEFEEEDGEGFDDEGLDDEGRNDEGLDGAGQDEADGEPADPSEQASTAESATPASETPRTEPPPTTRPAAAQAPSGSSREIQTRPTEPSSVASRADRAEEPKREPASTSAPTSASASTSTIQRPAAPSSTGSESREPRAADTAAAETATSTPVLLRPPPKEPSEEENEPLETVDVAEPARREPEPETESAESASESSPETPRRETPRLRPAERQPEPSPQPPPEPPVREGDLVGAGPGVKAPVLVRFDKPSYPPIARRMKAEGEVVISLLVDENGRVVETRLIKGVREGVGLNEAALEAARRARYEPATKNGVRVKMWTTLRIPFRL